MSLQAAIAVVERLVEEGVIPRYAVAGAVGAAFYLEPASTFDLDVLVSVDAFRSRPGSPLITLDRIRDALAKAGYAEFREEGIVVEGWPVQFLPAESPLDVEALDRAVEIEVTSGNVPAKARVLRAEHIMAIAVSVGREKDHLRVVQFITEGAYDRAYLGGILDRHGLRPKWLAFCRQAGVRDPAVLELRP
jgi:hypothetical protein